MYRRPPHVSLVLAQKRPSHGSMHCAGIVPNDQIPRTHPFDLRDLFILRRTTKESLDERRRFL
jgi:hypothetical protein